MTHRSNDIAIFSGGSHPGLAKEICEILDVPLLPSSLRRFATVWKCNYRQIVGNVMFF